MSIGWIPPTIGLLFVVIWLINAQIIVGERGTHHVAPPHDIKPSRKRTKRPVIQPHLD